VRLVGASRGSVDAGLELGSMGAQPWVPLTWAPPRPCSLSPQLWGLGVFGSSSGCASGSASGSWLETLQLVGGGGQLDRVGALGFCDLGTSSGITEKIIIKITYNIL
jgi:hypothetical protein